MQRKLPKYAFGKTLAAQPVGSGARLIKIEADVTRGLHSFSIVGLPDKAVEEARDRIGAALRHSGFPSPKTLNHKVVFSLAPADIKKEGSLYDLPLAIAYLSAIEEIKPVEKILFLGELSLNGNIAGVRGVLSSLIAAKNEGIKEAFIPSENRAEAEIVKGIAVYHASKLSDVVAHIKGDSALPKVATRTPSQADTTSAFDMSEINGQETAKRALEIAAAGKHNIVLYGPPGTGKTMLARALPGIMPALSYEEMLESVAIHSTAGTFSPENISLAPFRSPHHSASHTALVGGGTFPKAGEVTLAHNGILFLDELPEFEKRTIEALRQPLEDRVVTISRARGSVTFPANFMLVASMNPDSTLYASGAQGYEKHKKKISLPIVDRIDMWVEVPAIPHTKLISTGDNEVSEKIRDRVVTAREKANKRFGKNAANADIKTKTPFTDFLVNSKAKDTLLQAATKLNLSPRSFYRTLRVSRTIADIDKEKEVHSRHLLEALQYRPKDLF